MNAHRIPFDWRYDLRVILTCAIKDIQSAFTERLFLILSMLLPLNLLLLMLLIVVSGGQAPTAVVLEDTGPYAQQFVHAMQSVHSFAIASPDGITAEAAQQAIQSGQIVAVVTVPATFDTDLQAGRPIQLPVMVNNLNTDFTNDIRRAVPLAIMSFYAKAFPDQVTITASEVDVHSQDTGYIPYLAISIVVMGFLVGGIMLAGTASASEYERATIKELLLSPANRWAIATGKMLGALILSLGSALIVMFVIIVLLGIQPLNWGEVILFGALMLILFSAVGTLVGIVTRSRISVIPLGMGLALPLFFISGAFAPISFGSQAVAAIARIFPMYYCIVLFQHAFHDFNTSENPLWVSGLTVALFTVAFVGLAAFTLRRRSAPN